MAPSRPAERRPEALDHLRALARRAPDPSRAIEDAAAREAARELLERQGE